MVIGRIDDFAELVRRGLRGATFASKFLLTRRASWRKLHTRFSRCCGVATRNNVTRNSTSFFEPASRPRVFGCKDGEPYRNNYENRSWQNEQGNADQQDSCSNHGDDYAPYNLNVFNANR